MKNNRNAIEAMTIICNIQMMQQVSYGSQFDYNDFNGNSIDELRELQDGLIPVYNIAILNHKREVIELEAKLNYAKDFTPHKVEYYTMCIVEYKRKYGIN